MDNGDLKNVIDDQIASQYNQQQSAAKPLDRARVHAKVGGKIRPVNVAGNIIWVRFNR
ncbi:hypothetical protein SDC9_103223 [bioreactor metagenome]|uniref:Uncharacterized protein n=1 Tax=bioreactor metagenome TaxID=1076179 RepID=A0A645ATH3_9ZZZZ